MCAYVWMRVLVVRVEGAIFQALSTVSVVQTFLFPKSSVAVWSKHQPTRPSLFLVAQVHLFHYSIAFFFFFKCDFGVLIGVCAHIVMIRVIRAAGNLEKKSLFFVLFYIVTALAVDPSTL